MSFHKDNNEEIVKTVKDIGEVVNLYQELYQSDSVHLLSRNITQLISRKKRFIDIRELVIEMKLTSVDKIDRNILVTVSRLEDITLISRMPKSLTCIIITKMDISLLKESARNFMLTYALHDMTGRIVFGFNLSEKGTSKREMFIKDAYYVPFVAEGKNIWVYGNPADVKNISSMFPNLTFKSLAIKSEHLSKITLNRLRKMYSHSK